MPQCLKSGVPRCQQLGANSERMVAAASEGHMNYFSIRCWSDYERITDIRKSYSSYINSVKAQLPESLKSLTGGGGSISLNDANIKHLAVSLENSTMDIVMDGKWIQGVATGLRVFHLSYIGVTQIVSVVDPDVDGLSESGYGDHGFDEIEVLENNLYEHRMLFSSGVELRTRFRDFRLNYNDVPNP